MVGFSDRSPARPLGGGGWFFPWEPGLSTGRRWLVFPMGAQLVHWEVVVGFSDGNPAHPLGVGGWFFPWEPGLSTGRRWLIFPLGAWLTFGNCDAPSDECEGGVRLFLTNVLTG